MDAHDLWKQYVGEESPGEFMCQFRSRNPERCAAQYISALGTVHGIVRRGSWQETFQAAEQHTREGVTAALTAYLEETREEWQAAIEEREQQEREEQERARQEREQQALEQREREQQEQQQRELQEQQGPGQEAPVPEPAAGEAAAAVPGPAPDAPEALHAEEVTASTEETAVDEGAPSAGEAEGQTP